MKFAQQLEIEILSVLSDMKHDFGQTLSLITYSYYSSHFVHKPQNYCSYCPCHVSCRPLSVELILSRIVTNSTGRQSRWYSPIRKHYLATVSAPLLRVHTAHTVLTKRTCYFGLTYWENHVQSVLHLPSSRQAPLLWDAKMTDKDITYQFLIRICSTSGQVQDGCWTLRFQTSGVLTG
jgi:hypothetical protein